MRGLLQALWVAACLGCADGAVQAIEVEVVLSNEAEPYVQAGMGLKLQLTRSGYAVRVVQLAAMQAAAALDPGKEVLFVSVGTPAASWLDHHLPASQPLVYCLATAAEDWVANASRVVFGVSTEIPRQAQFALIAEALVPTGTSASSRSRRVGMLYQSEPAGQAQVEAVRQALPPDWTLVTVAVDQHESVAQALGELLARKVDIVWTELDPAIYNAMVVRSLLLTTLRQRVPVFGYSLNFVRAGALLGVGIDPREHGIQTAELVVQLLRSGAPKTIPPDLRAPVLPRYVVAINDAVARVLDMQLPSALRARAILISEKE